MSPLSIILFSVVKKLSELGEKYAQIKHRLQEKTVLNKYVGGFWFERTSQDTLTDGLEWCGLLVDYSDVFISCLDSHSDGTHSLQRIHWWVSDMMLHFQISSHEETNTYWAPWGYIFIFGWTIPLTIAVRQSIYIYKCLFSYFYWSWQQLYIKWWRRAL